VLLMDVYGREHPFRAIQHAQCEGWLETYVINFNLYCVMLFIQNQLSCTGLCATTYILAAGVMTTIWVVYTAQSKVISFE
jgi:uncharacterized membrane protein YobD (UPF0266 family)